jgi:hypothetical protein
MSDWIDLMNVTNSPKWKLSCLSFTISFLLAGFLLNGDRARGQSDTVYIDHWNIGDLLPWHFVLQNILSYPSVQHIHFTPGKTYLFETEAYGGVHLRGDVTLHGNGAIIKRALIGPPGTEDQGMKFVWRLDGTAWSGPIDNLVIKDFTFDFSGWDQDHASMIVFERGPISNVTICNCDFIDSSNGGHGVGTEECWFVNVSLESGELNGLIFDQNFCDADGYVLISGGSRTVIRNVSITNNYCLNSHLSMAVHRDGGATIENLSILDNVVVQPRNMGIYLGLDNRNASGDRSADRILNIDGISIVGNTVQYYGLNMGQARNAVIFRLGVLGEKRNVLVRNNHVVNVAGADKLFIELGQFPNRTLDPGETGPILTNVPIPVRDLVVNGNSGDVRLKLYMVNEAFAQISHPNQIHRVRLPIYSFDRVIDIPVISETVEFSQTTPFETEFYLYVRELDASNLLYGDASHFLRLERTGALSLGVPSGLLTLIPPDMINEHENYHVRIVGYGNGFLRAYLNDEPMPPVGGAVTAELRVQTIGSRLNVLNDITQTENRFFGHIWHVKFADSNGEDYFHGYSTDYILDDYWKNQIRSNHAILMPFLAYRFTGAEVPVPENIVSVPIGQLDLSFRIYPTDLSSNNFLLYLNESTFVRIEPTGALKFKDGVSESVQTLMPPGSIQQDHAYVIRLEGFIEGVQYKLKATLNFAEQLTQTYEPSTFSYNVIGAQISQYQLPFPFRGYLWKFGSNDNDYIGPAYPGAAVIPEEAWWDSNGNNDAILTDISD